MTEVWRSIPDFGGHYEASNFGRIRSIDRVVEKECSGIGAGLCKQHYKGKILSQAKSSKLGHLTVHIGVDKKRYTVSVHRLVLTAFIGPCPDGMEACHNNGIAWDNRIENLRWDTHRENNRDRLKHGTYLVGENHKMAKLTADAVLRIRASGLNGPQVAKQFGIGTTHAHRILTRQSWVHI